MTQLPMPEGEVGSTTSKLTEAITDISTRIYFDTSNLPTDVPNMCTIHIGELYETVWYTVKEPTYIDVSERGFDGTTARAWDAGANVARYVCNYDFSAIHHNVDDHETRIGDLIPKVTTPTIGNFPQLDAGGALTNSTYDETSFAASSHTHATMGLDDLVDVAITTPSTGQVLAYNGTVFANADPPDTGGSVIQVTPTAITIAHATTDAAAGKTATIDLTATHGQITQIAFYADFIAGQQVAWSGLVNAANGYSESDASIAFDGGVGTLTAGDYIKWGEEICLVGGSGTITTPMTLTRGQKGTTATYHPDNEQMIKCNDGIRLEFYPNSDYKPEERLFSWFNIMVAKFVTSSAISIGDPGLYVTTDPTVVSDFGFDDLILIDPTGTPELKRVAACFGDVANNTFDKSIFIQGDIAAHDTTKDVYRVLKFDIPIPVKFATNATTLYIKMFVDEKITSTVTGTLEIIGDKWS